MYIKDKKTNISGNELANYIEGFDVYNSKLVELLNSSNIRYEYYQITTNEYRPDLISADIYGSSKYVGILYFVNGISIESYIKGNVIRYIPLGVLSSLISKL